MANLASLFEFEKKAFEEPWIVHDNGVLDSYSSECDSNGNPIDATSSGSEFLMPTTRVLWLFDSNRLRISPEPIVLAVDSTASEISRSRTSHSQAAY
jgi:hypothetical protein